MQLQKAFQLMPCIRESRLKAKRLLEVITAGTSAGAANGHAHLAGYGLSSHLQRVPWHNLYTGHMTYCALK